MFHVSLLILQYFNASVFANVRFEFVPFIVALFTVALLNVNVVLFTVALFNVYYLMLHLFMLLCLM